MAVCITTRAVLANTQLPSPPNTRTHTHTLSFSHTHTHTHTTHTHKHIYRHTLTHTHACMHACMHAPHTNETKISTRKKEQYQTEGGDIAQVLVRADDGSFHHRFQVFLNDTGLRHLVERGKVHSVLRCCIHLTCAPGR